MAALNYLIFVAIGLAVVGTGVTSSAIFSVNKPISAKAANQSHNLIVGSRYYDDNLIYHENISEQSSLIGKKVIVNRTIEAPVNSVITQVQLLDQITDGTGAEPALMGGGPDSSWVEATLSVCKQQGSTALTYDQIALNQIQREIDILNPSNNSQYLKSNTNEELYTPQCDLCLNLDQNFMKSSSSISTCSSDKKLQTLIEERDSLLKTGCYTSEDAAIVKLNAEIRSMLMNS